MRMIASWSGPSWPTEYKVAARLFALLEAGSPRTCHADHNERAAVLGAVKVWPGNVGEWWEA